MMVCPRCDFEQPEDQYCANCGLNIQSYLRKPKSVWETLLVQPLFYVGMILAVFIALIIYIRASDRKPDLTPQPAPMAAVASTGGPASTTPSPSTHNSATSSPTVPRPTAPAPRPADAATFSVSPTTAVPTAPVAKAPTQLEVQFWEAPKQTLSQLGAESRGDQGNFKNWRLTVAEKLALLNQVGRKIGAARSLSAQPSGILNLDYPLSGGAQAASGAGFFMDLSVVKAADGVVEIEVAGQWSLKAETEGGEVTRFGGQVAVPFGGAAILSQMIHKKSGAESSAALSGPLSIIQSPEFLSDETELLLVIEAK